MGQAGRCGVDLPDAAASGRAGSLTGDLSTLGGAGTAFLTKVTAMRRVGPEMQLFWLVLSEPLGPAIVVAALLVAAGIVLVNRRT